MMNKKWFLGEILCLDICESCLLVIVLLQVFVQFSSKFYYVCFDCMSVVVYKQLGIQSESERERDIEEDFKLEQVVVCLFVGQVQF